VGRLFLDLTGRGELLGGSLEEELTALWSLSAHGPRHALLTYHRRVRVLLVSANQEKLPSPVVPLGVLYVAAAVRDAHDVRVLDLCFEDDPVAALEKTIADFDPEVVALGLRNLHDNTYGSSGPLIAYYERLARAVKEETKAPLVVGGAAITLQPAHLVERLGADHAVVGEGERTFRSVIDALARGETPPRIVLAAAARGETTRDLDALASPARDLIDPRYFVLDGTSNVQTKRGCAFQCTYCDYPDLEGKKVRVRDPARVADEIAAMAAMPGVSHGFVVDSVFNVPRSHALAVCREVKERGAPIPWVCYATPASMDEELVAAMASAGCVGAEIGTDTGSPRVLERLRKPFTLDQVKRTRRAFAQEGISDCHTFVLGAEEETVDEAKRTLEFVEELDPDIAVFVVFEEDRETRSLGRARHRDALLALLGQEAPKRPGWIVPELGVRFGPKLTRIVKRFGLKGPSWVHLAHIRRGRIAPFDGPHAT
jgi:hypothetical protein